MTSHIVLYALALCLVAATAGSCSLADAPIPASSPDDPVGGTDAPQSPDSLVWKKLGGPLGGLGYDVRMHPGNPDLMYVTDAWSGVNMSTDGGRTWHASNEGIVSRTGPSGDAIPVFSLTIDPNDPDVIWAGTQGTRGVYKSTDGGLSWARRDNGIIENEGISFRGFTVDSTDSDIVYAAAEISSFVWSETSLPGREFDLTQGVIYRTTDGGENWNAIWRGDNLARYVWIDPRDTNVIYVSTGIFDREAANSDAATNTPGGEGILKSTDGGETWFRINNGITNLYTGSLFMHPENPDILLAGAGNNAYRAGGGVFLTTDGGNNWEHVVGTHITSVEFAEANPNIAYASSGEDTFYRSNDGGHTWQPYSRADGWGWGPSGIRPGFPIDFQVDPRDADRIFVNNYGGGNFLSEDGGQTWTSSGKGYTGAQIHDITVSPDDPRLVYAIGRSGPFRSLNGGEDWQGIAFPPATFAAWDAVAVNPQNPHEILISDEFEGSMLRSSDAGNTWTLVFQQSLAMGGDGVTNRHGFKTIVFAPSDPQVVYAGMRKGRRSIDGDFPAEPSFGIYRSTDGGLTWHERNDNNTSGLNVNAMAVNPVDADIAYAATYRDGVFKTVDGGETWQSVNSGLPGLDVRTIVIDPANPETLYAGVENGGVYKSNDGGEHWQSSNSGIRPQASIRAVVVDPAETTTIYAADFITGVYRSTNGGSSWTQITDGLNTRAVKTLAISTDGSVLYAGTEGEGVFRLGEPPAGNASVPAPSTTLRDTGLSQGTTPSLAGPVLPAIETEVVFSDSFEDRSSDWMLDRGWQLDTVDGNTVLEGSGHQWAVLEDESWDDYVFQTRFRLIRGGLHFNYRSSATAGELDRYFIGISGQDIYAGRQGGGDFSEFARIRLDLSDEWHRLEIRGQGDIVNVVLDGTLLVAFQDEDPILEGGIAFETLEDSLFLIDDVEIRQAPMDEPAD